MGTFKIPAPVQKSLRKASQARCPRGVAELPVAPLVPRVSPLPGKHLTFLPQHFLEMTAETQRVPQPASTEKIPVRPQPAGAEN